MYLTKLKDSQESFFSTSSIKKKSRPNLNQLTTVILLNCELERL